MTLRRRLARLFALTRAQRLDRELDEEIVSHLELAEREGMAAGLSPDEARREARRRFGHLAAVKEAHRDDRSARWIEDLVKDVRYGLASLLRDRTFAIVTIAVLALGIGANTAMFSLVDAVLLKPLPYPDPERIVRLYEAAEPGDRNAIAVLNFMDWKRRSTAFSALSAERTQRATVHVAGEPARMRVGFVSADYFSVFGVEAMTGRTFVRGDDAVGAAPVVVVSHATWQSQFGGSPAFLNSTLAIDGEAHTVVGILPPGSFDRGSAQMWKPVIFTAEMQQSTRDYHYLLAVGRLAPGVTLTQARREMNEIGAETAALSAPWKKDWRVTVEPFDARLVNPAFRQSLYVVFGAVVLVLLIACANVSNLLLAKGLARKKEIALRAALGASRSRLVRQLLTEVAVLGALGSLAGVGLAHVLVTIATARFAPMLPSTASVNLDLRTLAFAMAVALAVVLLVGLLPALRTSFTSFTPALNHGGRGGSGGASERLRRGIVSAEVAFSLVLVCGAALLFKSLLALQLVDTGARTENVITASADLPPDVYPTPAHAAQFYEAIVERLETVPGVVQAAVSTALPLQGARQQVLLTVPGFDGDLGVGYKRIDPSYFDVLDIPLLGGRFLDRRDGDGARLVTVINQSMAARLKADFRMPDPLGQMVRMKTFSYDNMRSEFADWMIVGIVRDERIDDLRGPVRPVVYVPLAQVPRREVELLVRVEGDSALATAGVRSAIREMAPRLPLGAIRTMAQIGEQHLSGDREPAQAVGAFALVAGVLAALGLYGVLAQAVTQRRREIGIRMALGAHARDVLGLVVGNAVRIVLAGLVLGIFGVVALSGAIKGLLFQVSPLDPATIAIACAAMVAIASVAAFIPARRASAVNPITVLREEG
jgi:predicted permease